MKLNRIILSASAVLATAATALAFRPASRTVNPTLATFNSTTGQYTNVACARVTGTSKCADVTYYTTSATHTKLGKITPENVSE